jgi:hypothetical protein
LLLHEGGEGALGPSAGGGDFVEGEHIGVKTAGGAAEGAAGGHFATLRGQLTKVLAYLVRELSEDWL